MSIATPTVLVATSTGTDGTVFTIPSFTPGANKLLLLFVANGAPAGDNVKPTLSGTLGLTWTEIKTQVNTSNNLRGTLWWAKTTGSPPTGTIVMTYSVSQSSNHRQVIEIGTADLTTPIVQSDSALSVTPDNPGITLASAIGSGNATFGFNAWNNTTVLPVGSGYTQVAATSSSTTPTLITSSEYKAAGAQLVDWTTTANLEKLFIACEVADASNVAPVANAGSDITVLEPGVTVTLDGSATDSDGTVSSLVWTQTGGSPTVTLSGSGNDPCTFEAPYTIAGTTLTFTLTATDNLGATHTDTATVTVPPCTERAAIGGVWVPMKTKLVT